MKKNLIVFSSLIAILLSGGSCLSQQNPTKITILHTNDIHGSYLPSVATWEKDKPLVGGFTALEYYVKQERGNSERSLLLDAGDLMTGTLICDMKYDGFYGGALVTMMNTIGYQGWVFGNHDFDKGAENLRGLMGLAKFPVYCANFIKQTSNPDGSENQELFTKEPYHIYDLNGLKVGVIGLTYHQMVGMAAPEKLDGFVSIEPIATVRNIIGKVDSASDLIIVLSHLGIENDRELAMAIGNRIDLIVGGHSHTRLDTLERVNGVLIAQTGSNCRNLGRVDLTVAGDTVMNYDGKLIPMYVKTVTPDPAIEGLVDSFQTVIDNEYAVVIAQLQDKWESQYRAESNIGDWFTDAMKSKMKTDVAFLNSGGIRKNLDAGPVRKMDIHEILPFDNKIVIFNLTGKQLIAIAGQNVGLEKDSYGGSLQMSGLAYSWQGENNNPKLVSVMVNGVPIDSNRVYSVCSIDYVAGANADKYFGFKVSDIKDTGLGLTQLILEAVENAGTIQSKIEGRMKKIQ
jgi:5'-nucleotidase / UDP-sugar diphosphatase